MSNSIEDIRKVLDQAGDIYELRHPNYGDQWKKYGWRGALYNARRKVERAWAQLWNAAEPSPEYKEDMPGVDDLLDTINYCAMAILEVRNGNRDGTGKWW